MSNQRKRYSAGEKAKIAIEAIKGELTSAQISSKYSVHTTQVNQWKKQALKYLSETFTNKKKRAETEHELEASALYEQIGRLKVENEFLKKKCDLFTK